MNVLLFLAFLIATFVLALTVTATNVLLVYVERVAAKLRTIVDVFFAAHELLKSWYKQKETKAAKVPAKMKALLSSF